MPTALPTDPQTAGGDPGQQAPATEVHSGIPDSAAWLQFDPEVGAVLHNATQEGWDADTLTKALQSTAAYAETQGRRAALADPATADETKSQLALEVSRMLDRPTSDPAVQAFTQRLAQGQATMAGVQSLLSPADAGTPTQRVIDLAAAHGIPMSATGARQWTAFDEAQVDQQFAVMSQSLYPYKPPDLSYGQFASVFQDMHRQELGREVQPNDPQFQQMMEQSQGQLGAFRQQLRNTPEWAQTPQAQALIAQRTNDITQALLGGDSFSEEMARNRQSYEQQVATQMQTGMQPLAGSSNGAGGGSSGGGGGMVATGGGRYSVGQAHGLSAAEAWIITHESGGNPTAQNPHSTAFGIGQFLDSTWAGTGYAKTSDPEIQLAAMRVYIAQRYGTAEAAMRFWQRNNWY